MAWIKPLKGKIIVQSLKDEERTTESGLIISSQTAEKMRFIKGEVIATGKEVEEIKTGDIIIFDEYTTRELLHNGDKYYCLDEEKAYGVVNED